MKMFMIPELEVVKFNVEDVITASQGGNGTQMPEDEL